jgi:HTH-type transcriptional regulator/antitoxin HigA
MTGELDYAVPTGEFIEEWLDDNGVTQADLARALGCSPKHVSKLIHGAPLTHDVALRLSRVTGISAERWMQLETFYRAELARLELEQDADEVKAVLRQLPLKFLRDHGFMKATLHKPGRAAFEALSFYRAGTLDVLKEQIAEPAHAVAFRQSPTLDWAARMTWLRLVEVEAATVDIQAAFDKEALRSMLPDLRSLSREAPDTYGPEMVRRLATAGVQLAFVHAVPKAGTYGAARWHRGAPLIALSLHRRSEDQLWFTFFHELCHVLEHELTPGGFVSGEWEDGSLEAAANAFAGELLIPHEHWSRLGLLNSLDDVRLFAQDIDISPGIVVGRLHREGLWGYEKGHGLIQKLILVDEDD